MNVSVCVFGAVHLDDPVDSWKIDTSGRDISAEEYDLFLLNELEVDGCTLVLVLLSVQL